LIDADHKKLNFKGNMREVTILWAEDNDNEFIIYSDILKTFLGEEGINANIIRAEDGYVVYKHLFGKSKSFDVLLVDIEMSSLGGIDLVLDIGAKLSALPQIIISHFTGDSAFTSILSNLKDKKIIQGAYSKSSLEDWCNAILQIIIVTPPAILHLSDIHFGSFHALQGKVRIEDLISPLLTRITDEGKINLIIVSGDLASKGLEPEFYRAEEFLNFIAEKLAVDLNHIIIVPGNHDIFQNEESPRRFNNFIEFINRFYGSFSSPEVALSRFLELYDTSKRSLHWNSKTHTEEHLYSLTVYDELRTIVVGLNSVISSDKKKWNLAEISPNQLIKIKEALSKLSPPRSNYFRIGVFHHHLFLIPNFKEEGEPKRLIMNQGLVLRELISNKFKLILHGHTHYSVGYRHTPYYFYGSDKNASSIHIFCTGTLSGEHKEPSQNFFHTTVIRYAYNEKSEISTGHAQAYRLLEDSLTWEDSTPFDISVLDP
jgi:3',5'-cyclic AMP phosphodiesterase CpdA